MSKCNISDLRVGDRVLYATDKVHALKPNANREYPWVMGKLKHQVRNGKMVLELEKELTDEEVSVYLGFIARHPSPDEEMQKLVLLRPRNSWPATIRAINPDGTVNLDIESGQGGFTLHYDNVDFDAEIVSDKRSPHCCHVSHELHKELKSKRTAEGSRGTPVNTGSSK